MAQFYGPVMDRLLDLWVLILEGNKFKFVLINLNLNLEHN